jgi:ZIP family zinc transporter
MNFRGARLNNTVYAFLMTLVAGLSTGIGSLIALFAKNKNTKFLSFALGFSAGIMIYISTIEIFPKAKLSLCEFMGDKNGLIVVSVSFFIGILLIALIDKLIPQKTLNFNNSPDEEGRKKIMRMGLFTAAAISMHNLPEGLATFLTALKEPTIATPVVAAIAIHNIPEGIAVSAPIYYATKSRKKAFVYSFLSGLTEPLGAVIGYLLLMPFLNDAIFGIAFSAVAGIMVYISIDTLLPTAEEYGEHSLSVKGAVLGMAVMAASLILFAG